MWFLFWGTLNIRCRIIMGIQEGTIILTTIHIYSPPKIENQMDKKMKLGLLLG